VILGLAEAICNALLSFTLMDFIYPIGLACSLREAVSYA